MLLSRFRSLVLILAATLAAAWGATGSRAENVWQPFGPVQFEHDVQPFAFAEVSEFGGRDTTKEGVFFSYDRLYWSMLEPDSVPIGNPGLGYNVSPDGVSTIFQTNTLESSVRAAGFGWGNRFDLGYVDGDNGWILGILSVDQEQTFQEVGATVVFENFISPITNASGTLTLLGGFLDRDDNSIDDDIDGDGRTGRFVAGVEVGLALADLGDAVTFPTTFRVLNARNHVQHNGVELMRMHRFNTLHNGSNLELIYGVRYVQLEDQFGVNTVGGFSNDRAEDTNGQLLTIRSFWNTNTENNIIGPQIGGRWYHRRERWNFTIDGRFFAGFNFQSVRQNGQLGGGITPGVGSGGVAFNQTVALDTNRFEHTKNYEEWSPAAEMRVETSYEVTKAVALKLGWTGHYMAGIARGSNMTHYSLLQMGILDNNRQDFFNHGINFGVEVNR